MFDNKLINIGLVGVSKEKMRKLLRNSQITCFGILPPAGRAVLHKV